MRVDGLCWAEEIGGLPELIARSQANLKAVENWVAANDWIDFLAKDPSQRSSTSICLKFTDPWYERFRMKSKPATQKDSCHE